MAQPTCDIAIVGAGAAGLAAGIFAGEAAQQASMPLRIAVLDGARKIGAKILVAGGGRCNVTHDHVTPDDFNGPRNPVRNVLRAFDEQACVCWFEGMDVRLKREETGKLFPVTDQARTILDALLQRCTALGVEVLTDHRVRAITQGDGDQPGFVLTHSHGQLHARRLIMATGGRSLPKTGSDGQGWTFVQKLGHSVTPTYPALVPLVLEEGFFHGELSGLSLPTELNTFAQGKRIDRRTGSLLWTHFGISGPVVLDASRHFLIAQAQGQQPILKASFCPGEDFAAVERWLQNQGQAHGQRGIGRVLATRLPQRMAEVLANHLGVDPATPMNQLPRQARRSLVHALTDLPLPVVGDRGWNYAEVTAGGVPLAEVDFRTMVSRKSPGLYLVGEMLDVDGRIGGFNFQWAWATGHLAGHAAVRDLQAAPVTGRGRF